MQSTKKPSLHRALQSKKSVYPKPGPVGGRLIRSLIGLIKKNGVLLPLDTHILIAVSGGADSVALAHLLVHYGRRVGLPQQIQLLHVNHGWRGKESEGDARFVQSLGKKWGIPVIVRKVKPPQKASQSWEEDARVKRKRVFAQEAARHKAVVLTAHQADDLAETLIWRLFTGAAGTHGGGIVFQDGVELRPFLTVRKKELEEYLRENGQEYREDSTNSALRFLRVRIRTSILPAIEAVFPRAVEHLISAALAAQQEAQSGEQPTVDPEQQELLQSTLFRAAGVKVRRSQWELILQKGVAKKDWSGEIHLPDGWKLTCETVKNNSHETRQEVLSNLRDGARKSSKKWTLQKA